ncbi:hypothetical protein OIU76_015308 [Salix suchowensis]|nr:hypothetical protein OIU76_015308 [Salix suchowensis]
MKLPSNSGSFRSTKTPVLSYSSHPAKRSHRPMIQSPESNPKMLISHLNLKSLPVFSCPKTQKSLAENSLSYYTSTEVDSRCNLPFLRSTTSFATMFASEADFIVVSVEYGLFPARPIPACYEDSWAVLQWVASHVDGNGHDPWLNDRADFGKVFYRGG